VRSDGKRPDGLTQIPARWKVHDFGCYCHRHITVIINLSLDSGVFLDQLKSSFVHPLLRRSYGDARN
jgi:hypothetical protein